MRLKFASMMSDILRCFTFHDSRKMQNLRAPYLSINGMKKKIALGLKFIKFSFFCQINFYNFINKENNHISCHSNSHLK